MSDRRLELWEMRNGEKNTHRRYENVEIDYIKEVMGIEHIKT